MSSVNSIAPIIPNDVIGGNILPHLQLTHEKLRGACLSRDLQSFACVSHVWQLAVKNIEASRIKEQKSLESQQLTNVLSEGVRHYRTERDTVTIDEKTGRELVSLDFNKCYMGVKFPEELPNLESFLFSRSLVSIDSALPKMIHVTRFEAPLSRGFKALPKGLVNLKILSLYRSPHLQEISDLPSIEVLTAFQCKRLEKITGKMPFLRSLIAYYNPKLKTLPEDLTLLERLDVNGCRSLKVIGPNMNRLRQLDASNCPNLEAILSGIALVTLDCYNAPKLKIVYHEMSFLKVFRCYRSHIQYFPEKLDALVTLICHTCPKLIMLSASMKSLEYLDISRCWDLQVLPFELPALQTLIGFALQKLTCLPFILPNITTLNISASPNLRGLPSGLTNLTALTANGCRHLATIPGDLVKLGTFKGGGKKFSWLPNLPSLTSLELVKSPRLRGLPALNNLIDFNYHQSLAKFIPNTFCLNLQELPSIQASIIRKNDLPRLQFEIEQLNWFAEMGTKSTYWRDFVRNGKNNWLSSAYNQIFVAVKRFIEEKCADKLQYTSMGFDADVSFDLNEAEDIVVNMKEDGWEAFEGKEEVLEKNKVDPNTFTDDDWYDGCQDYIQAYIPKEYHDLNANELLQKNSMLQQARQEYKIAIKENRNYLNWNRFSLSEEVDSHQPLQAFVPIYTGPSSFWV